MRTLAILSVAILFSAAIVSSMLLSGSTPITQAAHEVAPFGTVSANCAIVANGLQFHCSVGCPDSEVAGSGGWNISDEDILNVHITKSRPEVSNADGNGTRWAVSGNVNDESEGLTFTVYAVCTNAAV